MGAPIESFNYMFCTYATAKFLPSLQIWLRTTCIMASGFPEGKAKVRVYLGADISESVENSLKGHFQDVVFMRLPNEVPEGAFSDYWAAEHYAWKIWIYHQLANDETLKGHMILYYDAGIVLTKLPFEMLESAATDGLCFIKDTTQQNKNWFSETFKSRLNVTEPELQEHQILGGICAMIGSSDKAIAVFNEAFTHSKVREIIAGPKWAGMHPNGQPFGHRHDQAILSLLRLRHCIATVEIDDVVTHDSLRRAKMLGRSFYIHRGAFKVNQDVLPGVTDAYVINLERRADRYETFMKNHGAFAKKVQNHMAIDGRKLKLTPTLARLLRPNDFFWKKAVAGCALSHLALWTQLVNEPADTKSYLILEDDVKMAAGWEKQFIGSPPPEDYDVLYLGGILPPNKAGFELVKEKVSNGWCRVAFNQNFGQAEPTRYFHFCNYAYVLSRRGAQKVLNIIKERDGFFTSGDHMICNHWDKLNIYFPDPLMAGCTQEADPAYVNSKFNNFDRIDTFDSDLWTNDERWSIDEVRNITSMSAGDEINISGALKDAYMQMAMVDVKGPTFRIPTNEEQESKTVTVYMINPDEDAKSRLLEADWLDEIFGKELVIKALPDNPSGFAKDEAPIVIVSRQDLNIWLNVFHHFKTEGRKWSAIHLSDEFGTDNISWYKDAKWVVRTYFRTELEANAPNVLTIPLGYSGGGYPKVGSVNRKWSWSFHGTKWFGRDKKVLAFDTIEGGNKRIYDTWNDPAQLKPEEYRKILCDSYFVPIFRGNHFETFRLYEALEAGAIPIVIREEGDKVFWEWLLKRLPLLQLAAVEDGVKAVRFFMGAPEHREKYKNLLLNAWDDWKMEIKRTARRFLIMV
jgi:GR25 family glycosyltransferase involved in LPS biosynthesis